MTLEFRADEKLSLDIFHVNGVYSAILRYVDGGSKRLGSFGPYSVRYPLCPMYVYAKKDTLVLVSCAALEAGRDGSAHDKLQERFKKMIGSGRVASRRAVLDALNMANPRSHTGLMIHFGSEAITLKTMGFVPFGEADEGVLRATATYKL